MFYIIYSKHVFWAKSLTIYMLDPAFSHDPVCDRGARFANMVMFFTRFVKGYRFSP